MPLARVSPRYPSPMHVTVLLFGSLREAAGAKELAVTLPDGATVADLTALLARDHAAFRAPGFDASSQKAGRGLRISVNYEIVAADRALAEGDEVGYLPPVSGGAGVCRISERPLDP